MLSLDQGTQQQIASVVAIDPLACKPPQGALRSGNCSTYGYLMAAGNDPIFTKVSLWKKPGPPLPCSPQKACDFVEAMRRAGGRKGQKLSLVCTLAENCAISGVQLGTGAGMQATVVMENVLLQNSTVDTAGGLLNVNGGGSFTGTNVTFRNGGAPSSDSGSGGCVFNLGTFACTDCVFDKCSAEYVRAASFDLLPRRD